MTAKSFISLHLKAFAFFILATGTAAYGAQPEPQNPFDRLDGKGPSAINVRVVDWAGNIELQISPMGKVKTLGFKIDRETDKNRPVLVIEYQWKHLPYRQIRRALLTTPLNDDFKIYYDASYGDRDRYILTNHVPEKNTWITYSPGPAPTQIWPDHHENLAKKKPQHQQEQVSTSSPRADAPFEPYSTDTRPPKPIAPDVDAEKPRTYSVDRPARPGVQLQQGQVEQDAQGTTRRRVKIQDPDDLSQGFDF